MTSRGTRVAVAVLAVVLVLATVPAQVYSTNHELEPKDGDHKTFREDMDSQDTTDEKGFASDSKPADSMAGTSVLDVLWVVRVVNEDGEPVSGARVVIDHFVTDASGGKLHLTVFACGEEHEFTVNVRPNLDIDAVKDIIQGELLTDPLPSAPIGTILSTDFYENVAIALLEVPCGEEEVDPTEEKEVEDEDIDISTDNEFDDGWTWDARDFDVDVTNKKEEDMTDFKVCIPDKDDGRAPSTSEEDAEDVVEPESGDVPDGWDYYYSDENGDGDKDCLVFFTNGDNYQPVEQGETGSFGFTTGYDDKENIGTVQYIPSYWDGSEHKEGEATEGFGPVPFAMNSGGNERALRTGSKNAEATVASMGSPAMQERVEEWRSDVEDKYNPAVEGGTVPGFVSRAVERRMLVKLESAERDIAVRTGSDGAVSSINILSEDEATEFDQQVTVETDAETVDSVRNSDDPAETARSAVRNGDVRLYGEGVDESLKTRLGTAGAKVGGGADTEQIYEEKGAEESPLGYRHVEEENETEGGSGMEMRNVVDRNGGVRGLTTEGCQQLIEAGGTEGLSENVGVYGDRDTWRRDVPREEDFSPGRGIGR